MDINYELYKVFLPWPPDVKFLLRHQAAFHLPVGGQPDQGTGEETEPDSLSSAAQKVQLAILEGEIHSSTWNRR